MSAPVDVTVELYLGGSWTDITSYVRLNPGLDITYGIQNESGVSDPASCTLVVNNRDGRFSPRNTSGAYYGDLKRNTPLRVTVGTSVRFAGEVSEFPSRWNENGTDVWAPLQASGILRRLLHSSALPSTYQKAVLDLLSGTLVAYWPMEDSALSTSIAPGIAGQNEAMQIAGTPSLASDSTFVCSAPLPALNNSLITGYVDSYSNTGEVQVRWLAMLPTGTPDTVLMRVYFSGGTIYFAELRVNGNTWEMRLFDGNAAQVSTTGTYALTFADQPYRFSMELAQNGADIDYGAVFLPPGATSGYTAGATATTQTLGIVSAVQFDPNQTADQSVVGHVTVEDTKSSIFDLVEVLDGYAGESVDDRMTRLSTQYGITITLYSGAAAPAEMGPQQAGSVLDVLRAAEKADAGGILRDSIDSIELAYITRTGRYNDQRALLSLDYSLKHISKPFEPTDDDQQIRNDIKANRVDGSSGRAELTSGALSTADYPNGVGPYPFEDTYGVYTDDQLPYLASWLLRLGTVDETRFPAVTVDLVKNTAKVGNCEAVRPGYRLEITNLPAYAGASTATLQVIGWKEHISSHERTITFVCVPGSPWEVFELNDSTYGVLDSNYLAY